LLHIICYKSLASRVFLKGSEDREITVSHTANWTCDSLRHYGCDVMDHPPKNPDPTTSNFRILGPALEHLVGKQIATDADVKQGVTSKQQTPDTDFFHAKIPRLVSPCNKCLNVSGDYVKVRCVTSATHAQCTPRSKMSVHVITMLPHLSEAPFGTYLRTRPHQPWGPPSLRYNGYRIIPGGKTAKAWRRTTTYI
jgi:hypothetical protein